MAEEFKRANPKLQIGFVGAHVAVSPEASLRASEAVDFVARDEFDYTILELAEGRPFETVDGISFKADGRVVHNKERATLENMDSLPFVTDVYKRDLRSRTTSSGTCCTPTSRSTRAAAAGRAARSVSGRRRSAATATARAAPRT